jgi:hypothetical protein
VTFVLSRQAKNLINLIDCPASREQQSLPQNGSEQISLKLG